MDLAKFVRLLQSRSLYFARSDQLGDPFEGSISRPLLGAMLTQQERIRSQHPEVNAAQLWEASVRRTKLELFVSCWHMNEHESAAMWRLYSLADQGIAITTSYRRLRECLPEQAWLGLVQYIDYEVDAFRLDTIFSPIMHKRASFSHEREVRAVAWSSEARFHRQDDVSRNHFGFEEHIDLSALVDVVYIHPESRDWYFKLVQDLMTKYQLDAPLVRSSMAASPIW